MKLELRLRVTNYTASLTIYIKLKQATRVAEQNMKLKKRIYHQTSRRSHDDNETVKKRFSAFIYREGRERGQGFANKSFLYSNLR
jgi:hypothetical protein